MRNAIIAFATAVTAIPVKIIDRTFARPEERDRKYTSAVAANAPTNANAGVVKTSAREDQANATTGRIRFFPDGSSTGGRITLKRGQREWHVNVAWLTGAVSVVDSK